MSEETRRTDFDSVCTVNKPSYTRSRSGNHIWNVRFEISTTTRPNGD